MSQMITACTIMIANEPLVEGFVKDNTRTHSADLGTRL